jgi:hypothetical protein
LSVSIVADERIYCCRPFAFPTVADACVFVVTIAVILGYIAGSGIAKPVGMLNLEGSEAGVILVAEVSEAQANAIFARLKKGMTAAQTWTLGLRSSCNEPGKTQSDQWTGCSDFAVFGHHYVEFWDGRLTDWH